MCVFMLFTIYQTFRKSIYYCEQKPGETDIAHMVTKYHISLRACDYLINYHMSYIRFSGFLSTIINFFIKTLGNGKQHENIRLSTLLF